MKRILALTLSTLLAVPSYVQADDLLAETICSYIEVDNKSRLRKVLKSNNIRIRNVFDSIKCDGQSMLHFAISAEANAVGGFIVSKLPVAALSTPASDGKTLLQWAEEFGHAASPVVAIAKDKISE